MAANILNLPLSTYAKLSPHPHLVSLLSGGGAEEKAAEAKAKAAETRRANGRAPAEARPMRMHASSLSHSHGSAVVRIGDTTAICGVRGEILPVESIPLFRSDNVSRRSADDGGATVTSNDVDELRDYDLLVPNIEFASGCAPQFLPGGPPTALAQTLTTRIYSLLHASRVLDAADLRIWSAKGRPGETELDNDNGRDRREGEGTAGGDKDDAEGSQLRPMAYWVLYIDLLFVSFDGNPLDAAWAAVMRALRDTRLPVAQWDSDRDMVICLPSSVAKPRALSLTGLPMTCSAAVLRDRDQDYGVAVAGKGGETVRHWLLLDPDRLEESLCRELATVVVDRSGGETRVRNIEKHGGTFVGREVLKSLVSMAEKRWEDFAAAMDQA